MQKGIGTVIRQLIAGDPTSAMETMRNLAERLSQQRNLFAALITVRIGLAIWPEPSSFELFGDLMMRAYGTEPRRLLALASASFTDAGKLTALAQDFGQNANTPLAILILAARGRQEHETPSDLTEAIQLALTTLEADADIPVVATQPALQDRSQRVDLLTVRETEIALLAPTHSNAAIASRLGLSVRTVENHIHSALKKTGTTNRQELFSALRR
ncbi:two-component system, response regulator [Leifsonia xyli subsp. xyli str. CTCB07]|uniref:Two-component system, response regulator n=2 Tax=Leifsonia xyli subsp. xyli TaxID=59736 RepID=Q6ACT2_LEIXX|nr:two-component system, response regulator [Leifsonia xyli subsp. xyli str. CTCB07]